MQNFVYLDDSRSDAAAATAARLDFVRSDGRPRQRMVLGRLTAAQRPRMLRPR